MSQDNLTLAEMRALALTLCNSSDSNPSTGGHFGGEVDYFLNLGIMEMMRRGKFCEDEYLSNTASGVWEIPIPQSPPTIEVRYVIFDVVELRRVAPQDFAWSTLNAGGTGYCDRYALLRQGGNAKTLRLGPQPPDGIYKLRIGVFRGPRVMVNNGDSPDIPAEFRMVPVYFAAWHMCIADVDDSSKQSLHERWENGLREYLEAADSAPGLQVRDVYSDSNLAWGH